MERKAVRGKKRVHKATGPHGVALLMSAPSHAAHVQSPFINIRKLGAVMWLDAVSATTI